MTGRDAARPFRFNISGKSMSVIEGSEIVLDPAKYDGGTPGAVEAMRALDKARRLKCGSGWTFLVDTDAAGAATILDYCQTVGESFLAGEGDPETRADGRALLDTAQKIRSACPGLPVLPGPWSS